MEKSIRRLLNRAKPKLPVLVTYNIPNRDVGQYSKGGAKTRDGYLDYIQRFARGVGEDSPIIIYEPDAITTLSIVRKRGYGVEITTYARKFTNVNR